MKSILIQGFPNTSNSRFEDIKNVKRIYVEEIKNNDLFDFLLSKNEVNYVEKPTFIMKSNENFDYFVKIINIKKEREHVSLMHGFNRDEFHSYFSGIAKYHANYRYYGKEWYVEVHPVRIVERFSISLRQIKIYFYIKDDIFNKFIDNFRKAHLRGGG
ncbi:hypothetical protein KHQ82_00275 [Mycoplasmatota bacterium]|nr:hypothetical protein KHQ82_00275 [Mycoplasmatota bacterium]